VSPASPPPSSPPVPLARLFAMAFRDLIDDLHDRLRDRGWDDLRPAYGFVLLAAEAGPTSVTALGTLMGMTKQAASKLVDAMEAGGYVARGAGAADARQRPVTLTPRGRRLLAAVEEIYAELEAGWAAVIGEARVADLRNAVLTVLVHRHGDDLPPIRPPW